MLGNPAWAQPKTTLAPRSPLTRSDTSSLNVSGIFWPSGVSSHMFFEFTKRGSRSDAGTVKAITSSVICAQVSKGSVRMFAKRGPPPPFLFWLAQLHNAGMVLTILLFLGHMAAFIFKANRHLIPAMFSGFVDADYAKHRHALWKPEEDR